MEIRNVVFYFCVCQKIGENNLHFVTSNQISTYRKLNFASHKQYFFSLLHSTNVKKTGLDQSILHIFYSEKIVTGKPLKVAAAKILFSSLNVIHTTCFDECFSFYVITGRYFFHKSLLLFGSLFNHHIVALSEEIVL